MGKSDLFSSHATLILLLFSRLCGFFLISPLFAGKSISKMIRLGLALACSIVIAPPLYKFSDISHSLSTHLAPQHLLLIIYALKEGAIGYLMGFIFSLLLEAAAFAGQVVGTLTGFSATELFDPLSSSPHPLLSRFFSLFVFTLFLTLDLHHSVLRLLYESFVTMPPGYYPFTLTTVFGIVDATHLLFHHALEFALFPLITLLSLIAIYALLSRFFSIFWIGFPLQLLVGLTAIAASISCFTPLLEHAFFQFREIVKKFIVNY
jgi:flagellar biosynthesis protein FliR